MTRPVFVDAMTLLLDAFRQPSQPRTLEAYWGVVKDLTDDEIKTARERALRELDFMPAPGKLLELAGRDRETGRDVGGWAHMRHEKPAT